MTKVKVIYLCCTCIHGCIAGEQLTWAIHTYNHSVTGDSVTGGLVYRGVTYPNMQGLYFYGDWEDGSVDTYMAL